MAANGFMQLSYLAVPASGLIALVSVGRAIGNDGARGRLGGVLLAVAGTALAFEGARLISGVWLIVGRGLQLAPLFLGTVAGATVGLIAGAIALVQGARQARPGPGSRVPILAGAAILALPLIPVFLLSGDGVALVVFDDLAEPRFSQFPRDAATLGALGLMLGGLTAILVAGGLDPAAADRRWVVHGAIGLGLIALVGGYAWHVWHGLDVETGGAGSVWPGLNGVVVLAGLAAGWFQHRARSRPGSNDLAFQPREESRP